MYKNERIIYRKTKQLENYLECIKKVFLRFSQYHMELKSLNYWINDPTHKITKKNHVFKNIERKFQSLLMFFPS